MFSEQRNKNKTNKNPKKNNKNWEEKAFLLLLSAKTGNLEFFHEEIIWMHFHNFFQLVNCEDFQTSEFLIEKHTVV